VKKSKKQSQILDAALSVYVHYGYRKATAKDVAAKLEMTQGNIYFYVKNKRKHV
jgi:AcrR family transcriptional regulator